MSIKLDEQEVYTQLIFFFLFNIWASGQGLDYKINFQSLSEQIWVVLHAAGSLELA